MQIKKNHTETFCYIRNERGGLSFLCGGCIINIEACDYFSAAAITLSHYIRSYTGDEVKTLLTEL